MYTLLSGLWQYVFEKDSYTILIIGLDNAGKTTFLEHSQAKVRQGANTTVNLSRITSTVGLNVGSVELFGVMLNFCDLGGQEELQLLWDKYYSESHGIIYVVDCADKQRISESKIAFDKMISSSLVTGLPMLIVANKQDVEGCLTVNDIRDEFHMFSNKIGERDCHIMPASALRGDNLVEGLKWMAERVKRNAIWRQPNRPGST